MHLKIFSNLHAHSLSVKLIYFYCMRKLKMIKPSENKLLTCRILHTVLVCDMKNLDFMILLLLKRKKLLILKNKELLQQRSKLCIMLNLKMQISY